MTARDDLYEFATAAFKETGVPQIVHEALTKMLDAYRAEVLNSGADALEARVADVDVDTRATWAGMDAAYLRRLAAASKTGTTRSLAELFERLGSPEPDAVEYGTAFKAADQDEIEVHTPTNSREEAEARASRYSDMYFTAYVVQRTVRYGAWTDAASQ